MRFTDEEWEESWSLYSLKHHKFGINRYKPYTPRY